MKKHDELVEEVRLLWCEECADGPLSYEYGYDPEVDDPCATGCEDLCRERARKVVSLFVSAVRDGRLKLPGEVARGIMESVMVGDKVVWRGADKRYRYIALRPLTGTGKEEE